MTPEESIPATQDESLQTGGDCPLCGTTMQHRRRDPLARMFGMLVLYVNCFVFLLILPDITLEAVLTMMLFAVWGIYLMRGGTSQWCPECWYEDVEAG